MPKRGKRFQEMIQPGMTIRLLADKHRAYHGLTKGRAMLIDHVWPHCIFVRGDVGGFCQIFPVDYEVVIMEHEINKCVECGADAVLDDAQRVYGHGRFTGHKVWRCVKYPHCDTYVGCHPGTDKALGMLAGPSLRAKRKEAHEAFDPFWKSGHMTRTSAYVWLAEKIQIPEKRCHMALLSEDECAKVVAICTKPSETTDRRKCSASQLGKYRRCQKLYAFEYVEGFRPPASDRQQFGTDVHEKVEEWLRDGKSPDNSPAGQVVKRARASEGMRPAPDTRLLVEDEFRWKFNDVMDMGGFIDLVVPPELTTKKRHKVQDHKTTSNLRWAKTPEQLEADEQAIIYAVDTMIRFDEKVVDAEWNYYAATNPKVGPRKPSGVKMVTVTFDADDPIFQARLREMDKDLTEIHRIRENGIPGKDLPPSPSACGDFGGCFHKDRCNLSQDDRIAGYFAK